MFSNLFSHIDIPGENVHILDGNAPDLEAECAAFEAKIKDVGGIDLFLGGVGTDGHIAFNEPGSSLASRTRVKTLAEETVRSNARFFGGDLDAVPMMALTVGVQTIMEVRKWRPLRAFFVPMRHERTDDGNQAREVVIIATGANKAVALQNAVEGGVSHMCTLSCLQQHPRSTIVADEDATLELKVKTIKVRMSKIE
jgi:glucosamine-6-phosphate deaminase